MAKKRLPNFEELVPNYPLDKDPATVRSAIGGAVNRDWYENTCIIRVSKALNYAKHFIPPDSGSFKTRKGADGKWYGLGVQQFWEWMTKTYGEPSVAADNVNGHIPYEKFAGNSGIIGFRVKGWNDASGHLTLFNGCELLYVGDGSTNYWTRSYKAALWVTGGRTVACATL